MSQLFYTWKSFKSTSLDFSKNQKHFVVALETLPYSADRVQITMKTCSRFCISAVALVAICFTLLSSPAYAWRRPSLLKQPLHKTMMGFGGQEHDTQVASKNDIIIPSPINNAVFCVRGGGGSNGPCIGIDLGKSMCTIL